MITKNTNAGLWEEYAAVYDKLNGFYPYKRLVLHVAAKIKSLALTRNSESCSLLDAGCGTGNLISLLSSTKGMTFTGIDKAMAMLDATALKIQGLNNIFLINGDIDASSFWNSFIEKKGMNSFDMVILNLVLFNIRDKKSLYLNLHKILKPEGFMLVTDFKPGWRKIHLIKSHLVNMGIISLLKNLPSSLRIERITKRIFKNTNKACLAEDAHIELIKHAGFDVHSTETVYEGQAYLITAKKPVIPD